MTSVSRPARPLRHVPTDLETPHPTSRSARHLRSASPASGHYRQLQAPLSDLPKEVQLFCIQGQLENHLPGVMDDPTGHLDQLPAEGGEGVMSPGLGTGETLEAEDEIVGDHPDAEKDCMGLKLPAGHPIQPQSAL